MNFHHFFIDPDQIIFGFFFCFTIFFLDFLTFFGIRIFFIIFILPFPICRNTSCCWFFSLQFFLLWISSSMEWMTTFFSFGIILLMIIIFGRRLFSCWWSDVWIFGQSAFGKCTKQFSCILKSCRRTSFNFSSRCWNCWFFIVIPRKEAKNGIVNFGLSL